MNQAPKLLSPPWLWPLSLLGGIGLFLVALVILVSPAQASPSYQRNQPSDDFCLACHQQEGIDKTLGNESLPVTINPTVFGLSVHAQEGIACVDCHTGITDYPHPDVRANSVRAYSLELYETCKECHADKYELTQDSIHQAAFDAGNTNAPLCSDCHNPHTQGRLTGQTSGRLTTSARIHVPQTCAQCHSTVYDQYRESVHGKALTEENNTDVPTCTDCHGVHNIQDPTTVSFHNSTPALCARCHTDASIMDRYGISTNVLDTYVADFHGTTVKLFEEQFPDQPTNKPVCTDCHGIHSIIRVSDPQGGLALRENLLDKCRRCHPGATANFSAAWMSHYEPSPEHYPIVYYVNLFYKFFIPAVLGGMAFFVVTDIYRRFINRRKERKQS